MRALLRHMTHTNTHAPTHLRTQLVAACVEYREIMLERRIAQAHVHERMLCTQTKERALLV